MRQHLLPHTLLLVLILFLGLGLIPPLAQLTIVLMNDSQNLFSVLTGYNIRACINTLLIGLSVSIVATVLGFIVAFAISATHAWGRSYLKALFLVPLFAPSIMPAIGLIYLIGNNGLLMNIELYGAIGVFLGGLIFALPHATLQLLVNLKSLDTRLLDAARSLGAGSWRRLFSIVVPHCRRGFLNAFLITFVLTITDFGVPKLLGGSFPVLATEIYAQAIGNQNFASAAFLSLWLLIPSLVAFYFSNQLTHDQKTANHITVYQIHPNQLRDRVLAVLAWFIVGFESLSVFIVIYGSFITFWPYQTAFTLANYSFNNSSYGLNPWIHSLILAFSVAIIGTLLTYTGSYLTQRLSHVNAYLKKVYTVLTVLPICIPGTVLGLGFALSLSSFSLFKGPVGSILFIVFNTVIHLYTVAHLTSSNTLSQINPQYEVIGKSLGVKPIRTIFKVVIPLSRNGLSEIFVYLFASAITTISSVVFLYTPDSIVAAVAAIDMIDSGFISEGAAMSSLIFISALSVRLITLKISH